MIARCTKLETCDVCLALAGTAGLAETGVPDRATRAESVRRLAGAGTAVPAVID